VKIDSISDMIKLG
jgi:predicted RNase H-like nuclease (RuvC/YqgF family)